MTSLPVVHHLRAHSGLGSSDAPNVLVLNHIPQRPPLYLLIDGLSVNDHLSAQMLAACADAYRKARGSQTGALQSVIRAADTVLRQSSEKMTCGISALLVLKGEAWLAQVEPAVCWLLREGKLLRWPAESVWLDEETGENILRRMSGGLGHERCEPDLTRIPLQAGDCLLLGTISVARQVGELLIAEAMARADPGMALHELVPDLDFTALSVEPSVPRSLLSTTDRFGGSPIPPHAAQAADDLTNYTSSIKRTPKPKAETETQPAVREPEANPPAREKQPTQHFVRPMQKSRATAVRERMHSVRRRDAGRSFSLPNLRPWLEVVVVTILFILRFIWLTVSSVLSLLARALPARESPPTLGRRAQARRPVMQSNPLEGRVLFTLAIAIPILVLLSVVILRNQTATQQSARFADLLAKATTAYQNALGMPSADAKKVELLKASQFAEEALSLLPRDTAAKEMQTKISNELDKLSNVTKFFFYPVLYEFKDKDSRPSAVIARGIDVYVLDTGLNRLYKFLLNDAKDNIQRASNPIVMRQGDERGPIVIGRLADIFWSTAGGGRSGTGVLTLTQSRQVVDYLPTKGINVLNLGAAPGWQEPTLGESFNGNLYALDAKSNRILKFQPTGEDYKNAPSDYLAPNEKVDFAGAVDIAIDGFVYVLLADGTLMKFDTGHLIPFDKKGLELSLRKPVAMVAQANAQSIYIADAGNKRIVQISKSGDYQRQLKPDESSVMNDLRGLAVDEPNRRFYFVNGNKLYMGTLQN